MTQCGAIEFCELVDRRGGRTLLVEGETLTYVPEDYYKIQCKTTEETNDGFKQADQGIWIK